MGLSPRHRLFVKHYISCKSATKAAALAGYSKKAAKTTGPRLLVNAGVAKAIEEELNKLAIKADIKAEDVVNELRKLAFVKLKDAYARNGKLLNVHDMPEDVQASLNGLESDEIYEGRGAARQQVGVTRKVKMSDKVKALELLGRHFKMFTDNIDLGGKPDQPLVILTMPANGSEAPAQTQTQTQTQLKEEG